MVPCIHETYAAHDNVLRTYVSVNLASSHSCLETPGHVHKHLGIPHFLAILSQLSWEYGQSEDCLRNTPQGLWTIPGMSHNPVYTHTPTCPSIPGVPGTVDNPGNVLGPGLFSYTPCPSIQGVPGTVDNPWIVLGPGLYSHTPLSKHPGSTRRSKSLRVE